MQFAMDHPLNHAALPLAVELDVDKFADARRVAVPAGLAGYGGEFGADQQHRHHGEGAGGHAWILPLRTMHECPACGDACDCDGEDHDQSAPDDCQHECGDVDDDDYPDQEDE